MLTLEQVKAVNDGFHGGDLNAALAPLEETIDLRANELPRLDKKSVAALKEGLTNGDDAATWAQAVMHPNISVRRFARKVLLPLGDEAAPLFAPLRARLERFWGEASPLPESNKPREAALRREQNEQVDSALEILLRADPEKFLEFYAQLADSAPAQNEGADEWQAWQERNAAAWKATQDETTRLLQNEWGEKFANHQERYKLPSRVLRDLDERARAKPEIAALWAQLGEAPWGNVAPEWNPSGLLMGTWNGYLNAEKPTGPTERVKARLRPVIWGWVQAAFDFERDLVERQKLARRCGRSYGGIAHYLGGGLGRKIVLNKAPALLLQAKAPLLPSIREMLQRQENRQSKIDIEGEAIVAELWLGMATALSNLLRPYQVKAGQWQAFPLEPETLRVLTADLPDDKSPFGTVHVLNEAAVAIEKERAARTREAEPVAPTTTESDEQQAAAVAQRRRDKLAQRQANDLMGMWSFGIVDDEKKAKFARFQRETLALDDEERIALLVASAPHPQYQDRWLPRQLFQKIWAQEAEATQENSALWPRAEPQLWARLEAQLQAHRRMETEPIEPDIAQKLTEREAKAWRARVRRERRAVLRDDAADIAHLLIQVDGLPAHLRAIELADRPSCREIRDQLERKLFYQLEEFPGQFPNGTGHIAPSPENWEQWKLDASWDAILERAETRLAETKDEWTRNVLERELAIGYYRRDDFARFEAHLMRPEAFPYAVAVAAVYFDDFAAWQALVTRFRGGYPALEEFWQAQQSDEKRRHRALEVVLQTLATANDDFVGKTLLKWLAPLDVAELEPHISHVENALESALVPVKKWAMSVLAKLDNFDRERAAQTASEALWSENIGLAKDAAKFLSVLATQDETVVESAWESLDDATSLENIPLCEAIYRALVKVKAKHKSLELSEAAREKLELLSQAQSERFGKFEAKLS